MRPPSLRAGTYRPDIQGLRAIAVTMVVIYHLYPGALPGGFAGVDVFFVISGYLITGHLARVHERTGRVRLVEFWGRRARRLVPAAALVLAVTWLVSRIALPTTRLADTAQQIRASALYVQNWVLAGNSVDYLKSANAPSPAQHFWSLSVEEQFYLFWPLLFIVAAVIARRIGAGAGRGSLVIATGAVAVASLIYSARYTAENPAAAYFVTSTRIWELALGGVLALLPTVLPAAFIRGLTRQGWLGWAGLGLVIASAFVLSGTSAFPGTVALLPVGGALLLIAGGAGEARFGPAGLTTRAPLVYLGDISYSLYLWHWPLIVFWTAYHGTVGWFGLPIAAASVLLAALTKALVEDRIRLAPVIATHPWRSLSTAFAAALPITLVLVLAAPSAPPWNGQLGPTHPGAAALADKLTRLPQVTAVPPLVDAAHDLPAYEAQHCEVGETSSTPVVCTFGDTTDPVLTVALVGDSIAGEWFPALDQIALQRHWRLLTDTHSQCPFTATMTIDPGTTGPYTACHSWGVKVLHDLTTTLHPDLVITSERPGMRAVSSPDDATASAAAVGAGMASYWRQLIAAGIPVVPIEESPEMFIDIPDCLSGVSGSIQACSVAAAKALPADPSTVTASQDLGGAVDLIDMNPLICGPVECRPIVGNVVVYRDSHHLTSTYSRSLAPFLAKRLDATGALRT